MTQPATIGTWYTRDMFTLRVPVTDAETGQPMDLSSASVAAWARTGLAGPVALPATISGSVVLVDVAAATPGSGRGFVEVAITLPDGTQTVRARIVIEESAAP